MTGKKIHTLFSLSAVDSCHSASASSQGLVERKGARLAADRSSAKRHGRMTVLWRSGRRLDSPRPAVYFLAAASISNSPSMIVWRLCFLGLILALTALAREEVWPKEQRTLIESRESVYNRIFVFKENELLLMTFGLNKTIFVESAFNPKDELELPAPYTRFITLGLAYAHDLHSVLEIGFGGGRTAWYLHRTIPDVPVVSVELDPVVVDLARKYFGVVDEPNFKVVNEDGRQFLAHSDGRYDIILLDAFHGPSIPFHLLTNEFYDIVKEHLTEGGVLLQNLDPSNKLFDSVLKTVQAQLPETDLYLADDNVVIAAYVEPLSKGELWHRAEERQRVIKPRYNLVDLVRGRRRIERSDAATDASARMLTDDFAPVDTLNAIERHNRQWPSLSPGP
jgi:spermidine synthase